MRGTYLNHLVCTDAVELAASQHKEQCELRLARIANGAEPGHRNGPVDDSNKVSRTEPNRTGTER